MIFKTNLHEYGSVSVDVLVSSYLEMVELFTTSGLARPSEKDGVCLTVV